MWGDGGMFPTDFEHAGVRFCSGTELRALLEGFPNNLRPPEVHERFGLLDRYIEGRDQGELRALGPPLRGIGQWVVDMLWTVLSALLTMLVIAWAVRFEPVGLWSIAASAVGAVAAIAIRRTLRGSVRAQWVTTAIAASSVGFAGLLGAVLFIQFVWG
jgi:hypothetical protein